jgi:hypothetical protein
MRRLARSVALWGSLGAAAALPLPAAAECISARHDGPRIYLTNSCRDYAQWALCVRVSDRSFDDYAYGTTAPMGTSEYGLFLGAGATFSYTVSACKGSGCKPARPQCPSPPAAGGGGAGGGPNAFQQCYDTQCLPAFNAARAACGPASSTPIPIEQAQPYINCMSAASSRNMACMQRCWQLAR